MADKASSLYSFCNTYRPAGGTSSGWDLVTQYPTASNQFPFSPELLDIFNGSLDPLGIVDAEGYYVWINEASRFRLDMYPFGGVKQSGYGREGIRLSLIHI